MRFLTKNKVIIVTGFLILFLLTWAPWLDNKEIRDRVLREKGWQDGTITTPDRFLNLTEESLQELLKESREKGVENGILVCDYKVMFAPLGRWVASCEGGHYVTFYGDILF